MAKHNSSKITAADLKRDLQERWLYLIENHYGGEQFSNELNFLDTALASRIIDGEPSDAMDCARFLPNFAIGKITLP